jgi:hypothetical protein
VRLRADGSKGAQTSSDEESEAEMGEEEEESDDEFCGSLLTPEQRIYFTAFFNRNKSRQTPIRPHWLHPVANHPAGFRGQCVFSSSDLKRRHFCISQLKELLQCF